MLFIATQLIFLFRQSFEVESAKSSDRFDQLHKQTRAILDALVDIRLTVAKNVRDQTVMTQILHNTKDLMKSQQAASQATARRTVILDTFEKVAPLSAEDLQRRAFKEQVSTVAQKEWHDFDDENLSIGAGILSDLHFPMQETRLVAISLAHHQTFRWILEDTTSETPDKVPWSNFDAWLRRGSGTYWISGKAGSGKSTLMRYIYENPTTMERLQEWARDIPLCIAGFFFWNSGSVEQRSQTGLLKTLLYSILKDYQELIPIVFPTVWVQRCIREIHPQSKDKEHKVGDLPYSVLLEALTVLISGKAISLKVCFFIDGLDEFEGDHTELAELFTGMASNPNIKACLSSRPLLALHDAFSGCPGLRLQDLTVQDIRKYITDKLGNNHFYQRLQHKDPERAIALTKELSARASGVFLWVVLVVKSLLNGLRGRDGIMDLRRRLAELPTDLETLYQQMMVSGIESFYQRKASEVFQILRAAREIQQPKTNTMSSYFTTYHDEGKPLSCLGLSFTNEEDSELALQVNLRPLSMHEISERSVIMQDRLKIWCAGLVEVQDSTGTVQYLHRTVRDYIERENIWESLMLKTADSNFEPNISLLQSCILQIKVLRRGYTSRDIAKTAIRHAFSSESSKRKDYVALLNELDRTMRRRVRGFQGSQWFHELASPNDNRTLETRIDDKDTFASYAIQHGLYDYLQESLRQDPRFSTMKTRRPLLDYAIDAPADLKIVTLLLENGANPNEFFKGITVWERLLCAIYSGSTNLHDSLRICTLFAKHGANPEAVYNNTQHDNSNNRQLSTKTMIFTVFYQKYPRETDELLQLLGFDQANFLQVGAQSLGQKELHRPHQVATSTTSFLENNHVESGDNGRSRPQSLNLDQQSSGIQSARIRLPNEDAQEMKRRQGYVFKVVQPQWDEPRRTAQIGLKDTTHVGYSKLPEQKKNSWEQDQIYSDQNKNSSLRKRFVKYFRKRT